MIIDKLAIAVAFFYTKDKLKFLSQTLANIHLFAKDLHVFIFTNTQNKAEHGLIEQCFNPSSNIKYTIFVPKLLGHPYFLTWSHKDIFEQLVRTDNTITYYMYLEDDVLLTKENIDYYLEGENKLQDKRFFPSFLRYEVYEDGSKYAVDVMKQQEFHLMSKIQYDNYYYVNFSYTYQGVYLLNSRLMMEYFDEAHNPDYKNTWNIREQNTAVVLFHKVPKGFKSRNLVGCTHYGGKIKVDERCLIHHLPNKYVEDKENFSKLYKVDDIIAL